MNLSRRHVHGWSLVFVAVVGAWCYSPAVAVAQQEDQAALRHFNVAAELQNFGSYDKAAQKWTEFIQKFPRDARLDRANYYLGICRLHAKQFAEAAKSFQNVLGKYPQFKQLDGAQYNLGMAYYQLAGSSQQPADYKAAATAFAQVVAKFPQSKHAPRALYFQGESAYSAGEAQTATAAFEKLVATYPQSPLLADAYYVLGTIQQEQGDEAGAVATFKKFLADSKLAQQSLAPEIRLRLGMSLFNLEKFEDAEKQFASVAKVADFQHADFAQLRRGQCLQELGKLPEAANEFNQLLSNKNFSESPYRNAAQLAAGKCHHLGGKLSDALKLLQPLANAQQPESAEAAYWLGKTLLADNKPQDAFAALDRAAKQFTSGEFAPYLQLARADALYELPERRQESAALYAELAAKHPDHQLAAQAVYMAALTALGAEDFASARKHAEAFLAKADNAQHELAPAVLYVAAESYLMDVDESGQPRDTSQAEKLYRQLVAKSPQHQRVPRAHLRIAWCLQQKKEYDEAVKYLRSTLPTLKEAPQQAEAQLLIGRSLSAGGNDQEAVAAYDAAIKADATWERNDEVLLFAAQSLRSLGNLPEAAKRLNQLNSSSPNSAYRDQALYQLGEIAQEQKEQEPAISFYQQVIEKHADSQFAAPARYGLAACQFAKQDYANALTSLNQLLARQSPPEIAGRATYLRGLVQQRLQQYAPAVKDLQAFLASKPEGSTADDAQYALALCLISLNQFPQATAALDALLKSNPNYSHADKIYYEMGHALVEQKKEDEAQNAFRTLVEKFPQSQLAAECWFQLGRHQEQLADAAQDETARKTAWAKGELAFASGVAAAEDPALREKLQYKLGDARFRQGNYPAAAEVLLLQIKEHPGGSLVGPGRYLAAECLYREQDFAKALPLFAQVAAAKVEQYHAQSLYRAGKCAGNIEKWSDSQKYFADLIGQFSTFEQLNEARYGMALALQKQNKLSDARSQFEQVTKDTSTEVAAKARFMIGEIDFGEGKYEQAIENFLAVAVGYPYKEWQALARFETGRCFMELKQNDKAIAAFQAFLKSFPDHPRAKDATRLIADL
jgi:TolA-binding protein